MSKKIFIDTLFVVALVNQRDQHHARALALSQAHGADRFLTTEAVLVEIGNALARNYKDQAIEVIDGFLSSDDVEVIRGTPDLFDAALTLYKRHRDKQWGLTDCLSFEVMRQAGVAEVLTMDQHFVQAGFQALMRGA